MMIYTNSPDCSMKIILQPATVCFKLSNTPLIKHTASFPVVSFQIVMFSNMNLFLIKLTVIHEVMASSY